MTLESHPNMLELRRIILRLSLISHAPVQGYDFAPSEVGRGDRWRKTDTRPPIPHLGQHSSKAGDTQIPRGDVDRKGDLTPEFRQKSDVYFRKRIGRLRSERDLAGLLKEAEEALEAWQRTPFVEGLRPAMHDPRWKQWVAQSPLDGGELARLYGVSRQYIHEVRKKYRDAA